MVAITVRDRLIEASLVGLSAGGTGAAIAWGLKTGFQPAEVFAFAGAIIGAGATVAGAVWVSDRTINAAHRRETSALIHECEPLLLATRASLAINPAGAWPPEFKPSLFHVLRISQEVVVLFREALNHAKTLDFRQRVTLIKSVGMIEAFEHFYHSAFGEYEDDPYDERTWQGVLLDLEGSLRELLAELRRK